MAHREHIRGEGKDVAGASYDIGCSSDRVRAGVRRALVRRRIASYPLLASVPKWHAERVFRQDNRPGGSAGCRPGESRGPSRRSSGNGCGSDHS